MSKADRGINGAGTRSASGCLGVLGVATQASVLAEYCSCAVTVVQVVRARTVQCTSAVPVSIFDRGTEGTREVLKI